MKRLARDRQGAVVLETLIAIVPILLFFIGICSAADGYAHYLIVQRAASAAARAAAVVLPDDPRHYGGVGENRFEGKRKSEIVLAATTILDNSKIFNGGTSRVSLAGHRPLSRRRRVSKEPVNISVTAEYKCIYPLLTIFCGRGRRINLTATASLPFMGATYAYQ